MAEMTLTDLSKEMRDIDIAMLPAVVVQHRSVVLIERDAKGVIEISAGGEDGCVGPARVVPPGVQEHHRRLRGPTLQNLQRRQRAVELAAVVEHAQMIRRQMAVRSPGRSPSIATSLRL